MAVFVWFPLFFIAFPFLGILIGQFYAPFSFINFLHEWYFNKLSLIGLFHASPISMSPPHSVLIYFSRRRNLISFRMCAVSRIEKNRSTAQSGMGIGKQKNSRQCRRRTIRCSRNQYQRRHSATQHISICASSELIKSQLVNCHAIKHTWKFIYARLAAQMNVHLAL